MLMKIHRATRLYEAWLAKQIHLLPIDLALKHKTMKRDAFLFFRSTFYLWMQVWPEVCRDVVTAPLLLAMRTLRALEHGETVKAASFGESTISTRPIHSRTSTIWCDSPSVPRWLPRYEAAGDQA